MDNMYICAICIDNIIKIRAVYIRRGLLCAECWALLCSGLSVGMIIGLIFTGSMFWHIVIIIALIIIGYNMFVIKM